jgi:DNA invertase Pin-like site-specific DNA recombinase
MSERPKRAALYVRVSADKQSVQNQIAALSAVAQARGWTIVETYSDAGLSEAKECETRQRKGRQSGARPGLDQMLKDAAERKFDVVMAWAIDSLGRSLIDLLGTIETLEACGVDLYLDQQSIDTTTPAGKPMFSVVGAFAAFERATVQQRIRAGLDRARKQGKLLGRQLGQRTADPKKLAAARKLLAEGTGILKTAQTVGLGTGTVHQLKREMAEA